MHYPLLVIITGGKLESLLEDVREVMTPYWEGLETEDGESNPQGYWDWYVIGGRYSGWIPLSELDVPAYEPRCDATYARFVRWGAIEETPCVLRDDVWYGRWYESIEGKKSFVFHEVIEGIDPDALVVIVDCHI